MSVEDRALKALRALIKEIGPGGRVNQAGKEIKERAERAGVRLMDEVVSMIAQRRVRTHGRKPWERPEQLEAPKEPRSWRERIGEAVGETVDAIIHPKDVVGAVHGSRANEPVQAERADREDRGAAKEEAREPIEGVRVEPTRDEPAKPDTPRDEVRAEQRPVIPSTGGASIEPAIEPTSSFDPRLQAAASPEPLIERAAVEQATWVEAGEAKTPLTPGLELPGTMLPGVVTDEAKPTAPSAEELEPDDAMTAPLPSTYPGDRLVFVARDPEWAHAYWMIQLGRIHHALAELGGGHGLLRLVDAVTDVPLFEVETWAERGRYDLRVPWADHAYRVELVIAHQGRSIVLERSRAIVIPPAMPRPAGEVKLTDMTAQARVLARARDLANPPRLDVRHEVRIAPRSRFELAAVAVSVSKGPEAFAVAPNGRAEARPAAPFWRPGASEQVHDQRARDEAREEGAIAAAFAASMPGVGSIGASEHRLLGSSEAWSVGPRA